MRTALARTVGLCLLCAITVADSKKDATVAVRKAALRSAPSYRSKVIGSLPYEQPVVVLNRKPKSSWVEVQNAKASLRGWMSERSLYTGKVGDRKGTSDRTTKAGKTTASLAGRGFNEEVEKARRANASSNVRNGYQTLDRALGRAPYNVAASRVGPFMDDGDLKGAK